VRLYLATIVLLVTVVFTTTTVLAQDTTGEGGDVFTYGSPSEINWNLIMFPTQRRATLDKQGKAPFKLFDNVYSVGFQTVGIFLITTSAGLVLIDAGWAETADMLVDNIRRSGFDPAQIRYIFITHAANDHYGGAGRIKQLFPGVRIGTSREDWDLIEEQLERGGLEPDSVMVPFSRDMVVTDGQTLTLGDTRLKFYVLPGRTPGALGIEYPARDQGMTYRAMSTGAFGNYPEPRRAEPYLASIARLKNLGPWEVWLPNHVFMTIPDLEIIEERLTTRGRGPHPGLVAPEQVDAQLDFILTLMRQKMAIEQYQSSR
jgi:metallo-beta-lactamase class B